MDKKYIFSQPDEQTAPADQVNKKDRFSSMIKDLIEVPFNSVKDSRKEPEKREDEGIMQFSSGTTILDDMKKPVVDEVKQPDFGASGIDANAAAAKPREEAYITKDVVINGSVSAVANLRIDGTVNGNVTCENDATVCGTVEGDITANNVKLFAAQVKGDVNCKNAIVFDKDAIVNGNVTGKKIEINGKIKGNISVELGASILGNAVVLGDVTSGSISVAEGALIKGNIQINRSYDANESSLKGSH